ARAGGPLLAESLVLAHAGRAPRLAQDRSAASYARKLTKRDGVVDWALDAGTVWSRQRAVTPWPGASTWLRGRHLLLMQSRPHHLLRLEGAPGTVVGLEEGGVLVACSPGSLRLLKVKPEGKGELAAQEWARGARLKAGDRLGVETEAHA